MLTIRRAPAWLVVQDLGWTGHRSIGLPPGGAMDRHALAVANLLVGNPPGAAALEWALGPGSLRFEQAAQVALAGARATATLAGRPLAMHATGVAAAGDELVISEVSGGRFVYLAVTGGIDVPLVMGARATYLRGGFGGLHGRRIKTGDYLRLGEGGTPGVPGFQVPGELLPPYGSGRIRVTPGPQAGLFGAVEREGLVNQRWRIAAASDRMGYRLEGSPIPPQGAASLASEPACPGAVQVPDDGLPIILMADGPTVGGYPKLAVVAEADLPVLAQGLPGEDIQFEWIEVTEAQRLYRRRAIQLHTLAALLSAAAGS